MDPLTHTLVGTSLAATKLGEKTPYATAALIVGANLPDVDVLAYAWGEDAALGFRRGWTHGVLALVVLPLLLAAGLWLWGRWRGAGSRVGWLVALSYVAVLTHPMLDWLNTYGMRWLMPFDDRWFYGDAVFIMDPWLWLALGVGWLLGREPGRWLLIGWAIFGAVIALTVTVMAPRFLPLVALVAVILLAAMRVRPRASGLPNQVWASVGLLLAVVYVATLLVLHDRAEKRVRAALEIFGAGSADRLMVGPVPADPLTWDVVVARGDHIEYGRFSWRRGIGIAPGTLSMSDRSFRRAELEPAWSEIERSGQIAGFLSWVRFPWIEAGPSSDGRFSSSVMDARYVRERTSGFGSARVVWPPADDEPAGSFDR